MGCAGGRTPQHALREYRDALAHDRAGEAWRLMSEDARAATSRERHDAEFARRVEAGRPLREALRDAGSAEAQLSASLPYSRYETAELAWIDGRWQIVDGVGRFYSQATPRDATISFIRAIEQGDAAALRRLAPASYRGQMSEDDVMAWLEREADTLEELVSLLSASIDAPIAEAGAVAVLRYGASELRLANEGGRWVIVDFD